VTLKMFHGRPMPIPGMPEEDWAEAKPIIERQAAEKRAKEAEREAFWQGIFYFWLWFTFPPSFAVGIVVILRAVYLFVTTGNHF